MTTRVAKKNKRLSSRATYMKEIDFDMKHLYTHIIELCPDGIVIVDMEGIIRNANRTALNMLGYAVDELVGKHFTKVGVFRTKDLPKYVETFQRVLSSSKPIKLEIEYKRKDGSFFWSEVHVGVLKKDGKVIGIQAISRDISDQKNTEEQIRTSEKLLREVFNSIQDGISVLSSDLMIIRVNPWMEKMYADFVPLIGKKCYEVYQQRKSPCPWCPSVRALKKKTLQSEIVPYPSQKNPTGWIDLSAYPLVNEQGHVIGVIEHVRDITDKKKSADELARTYKKLYELNERLEQKVNERTLEVQQLLKQKDELINQLGHDLKNPLVPITNLLPFAVSKIEDPEVLKALEIVSRNIDYVKNLTVDILRLAKLNSPTVELKFEEVNLHDLSQSMLKNVQVMFDEKKIAVINNIKPDIIVRADKLRLKEVLTNISSNAIKFVGENGHVKFGAEDTGDFVTVFVQDDGVGIKKDQLDMVFTEFYKTSGGSDDSYSSGLGLPICKRIVEKHGGKIWVESPGPEKGSTIYFTLPKKK